MEVSLEFGERMGGMVLDDAHLKERTVVLFLSGEILWRLEDI